MKSSHSGKAAFESAADLDVRSTDTPRHKVPAVVRELVRLPAPRPAMARLAAPLAAKEAPLRRVAQQPVESAWRASHTTGRLHRFPPPVFHTIDRPYSVLIHPLEG
jgi:hypothetical protein